MTQNHADVFNLNYRLLCQFRELYSKSRGEALLRYQIEPQDALMIMNMSHDELYALATSSMLLFKLKPTISKIGPQYA